MGGRILTDLLGDRARLRDPPKPPNLLVYLENGNKLRSDLSSEEMGISQKMDSDHIYDVMMSCIPYGAVELSHLPWKPGINWFFDF